MRMRRRTWLLPLLVAVPVLLLCLARRPAAGETGLPVDQDSLPLWALSCCAGLFGLALARLCASVLRQRARTGRALAPLLALPPVAAPDSLAELLRALRLEARTRVVDLDTPVALCCGLLRPRLLISTGVLGELSTAELEAVLRHEAAHLHRRDPLRLVLACALAEVLPLPMLSRLAAVVPVAQELAADRVVLAAVGAQALGGALLKLGDALGPLRDRGLALGPFGAVDARLAQVLGEPVPPLSPSVRSVVLTLVGLGASPFLCLLPLALLR
jgi:Zn-dependent protease with chaperone function